MLISLIRQDKARSKLSKESDEEKENEEEEEEKEEERMSSFNNESKSGKGSEQIQVKLPKLDDTQKNPFGPKKRDQKRQAKSQASLEP